MIELFARYDLDPKALVGLVEDEPERYRLDGPFKLRFSSTAASEAERIRAVEKLLLRLGATEPEAASAAA